VNNDQAVISGDGVFPAGREADVEIVLLTCNLQLATF
jgi:hypothetical protein